MSSDVRQFAWMVLAAAVVGGCVWYQAALHPVPRHTSPQALCVHEGRRSSHGARLHMAAGWMQCDNGRWTPVAAADSR